MPTFHTRIVTVLLIPCMMADHITVVPPSKRIGSSTLFSVEALASRPLNVGSHPAKSIDEYQMANAAAMMPSSGKLIWVAQYDRRHQHPEREIRPPRQFRISQHYYDSKRSRHGRGKRSSRPGIPYKAGYNPGVYPHKLIHAANQIDYEAFDNLDREHPEYSEYAESPEDELESAVQEGSRFQRGMLDQPQFTDRKVGTMARIGQSKSNGSAKSTDQKVLTEPAKVVRMLLIRGYALETILHALHLDVTKNDNIVGGSDFYIGKSDWESINRLAAAKTTNRKYPTRQALERAKLWDSLPLQVHVALSGMPDDLYNQTDPEVLQGNDLNQYRWEATPYWMKMYFACSVANHTYPSRRFSKRRNSQYAPKNEPNGSGLNRERFIRVMSGLIPSSKESELWTIWNRSDNRLAMLQRFAELVKGRVPTIQDLKLAAEPSVPELGASGKSFDTSAPTTAAGRRFGTGPVGSINRASHLVGEDEGMPDRFGRKGNTLEDRRVAQLEHGTRVAHINDDSSIQPFSVSMKPALGIEELDLSKPLSEADQERVIYLFPRLLHLPEGSSDQELRVIAK